MGQNIRGAKNSESQVFGEKIEQVLFFWENEKI